MGTVLVGSIVGAIAIVGILVLIGVLTVLGLRNARHERQLEHTERMQALEMGRTFPGDEPWWTPVRVCAAIGAGVPVIAFGIAFLATLVGSAQHEAWVAASVVGTAGVICGTILAMRLPAANKGTSTHDANAKPVFHPDDYDVVGRHG